MHVRYGFRVILGIWGALVVLTVVLDLTNG